MKGNFRKQQLYIHPNLEAKFKQMKLFNGLSEDFLPTETDFNVLHLLPDFYSLYNRFYYYVKSTSRIYLPNFIF